MSNYCQNCNKKTDLFFCSECGTVLTYPSYIANDEDRERCFREKISVVVKNYKKAKSDADKITSDTILTGMVRQYHNRMAFLFEQCKKDAVYKFYRDIDIFPKMKAFADRCKNNECQIVLVGTMNAGKSCLINAVLGRELASINMLPETATLTKFKHTQQDTIKVTFYNQTEWAEFNNSVTKSSQSEIFKKEYEKAKSLEKEYIDREPEEIIVTSENELKEKIRLYSSASEPIHYFVKELEIGLKTFDIPPNVVFVDTPGLNDPVSYRSEITRNCLKKANVVLCLTKAKALEEAEFLLISNLIAYMRYAKDRVYILGTQYDVNNEAVNSWETIKSKWIEHLSVESCFGSEELAEKKIMPVAPYFYTLLKKFNTVKSLDKSYFPEKKDRDCLSNGAKNILEDEDIIPSSLINDNYNKLLEFSNIDVFRQMLIDVPVGNADKIIIEDIAHNYSKIKDLLNKKSADIQKNQVDVVKNRAAADAYANQIAEIERKQTLAKRTSENLKNTVKEMNQTLSNELEKIMNNYQL
jgi:GTPase SAR1 family protein